MCFHNGHERCEKDLKMIISQLLILTKEAVSSKGRSSNDMEIDSLDVNALSIKRYFATKLLLYSISPQHSYVNY